MEADDGNVCAFGSINGFGDVIFICLGWQHSTADGGANFDARAEMILQSFKGIDAVLFLVERIIIAVFRRRGCGADHGDGLELRFV